MGFTSADANNVVVDCCCDKAVFGAVAGCDSALEGSHWVAGWVGDSKCGEWSQSGRRRGGLHRADGIGGSLWNDGHVGQLAIVGRAHWVNGKEVERVRVEVITGL